MDLDLKSLRLLIAVCEEGTIKRAARREHIEPSAVSKRLTRLETALGITLLTRGRRGARPTAAGQALLEHGRTLQHVLERIEADATAFAGGAKGHVRLVATASAVAESLLDDVAAFMRVPEYQGIRIEIEERLSSEVVKALLEGRASLGVCWDSADRAGLTSLPYRSDELVLAVHPDHPLAPLKSLRFEQSLDYEHVGLPPATAVYSMLHRAAAQAGRSLAHRVIVSNFDAALRVVRAGLGVSVIPREVTRHHIATGELVALTLEDEWASRRFVLCHRTSGELPPASARLAQFMAQRASGRL